ncbi:MAG: T9SS type A sorting domain-containing protein, partial [Candidatus Kapabacteria bacterium]|nr:T9SS type A sorting domain-containing protein [Candidatus Kapabacteria bacterium]
VSINGKNTPAISATILSRSIGTPLPYVRFATLEYGYPNPAQRGSVIKWAYRIDKESAVRFRIYNGIGKLLRDDTLRKDKGVHQYSFVPDLEYSSGMYTLVMETNSGTQQQRFVILN